MRYTLSAIAALSFIAIVMVALPSFALQIYNGFDISGSLIPRDEIMSGGPPKDGIPAILNPKFESADKAAWLRDSDLVTGVMYNGQAKAYPLRILVWHEAANDTIGGVPILVSYCPLCGSTLVYKREPKDAPLTFGISGLLHQSNVLLYDHQTQSLWSQLEMRAVTGKKRGEKLELFPSVLASWGEWRKKHPDTLVLSRKTGFNRNYSGDPYRGYESSKRIWFPVKRTSSRFHPKEKILVVSIGNSVKAYPFSELRNSLRDPLEDKVGGTRVRVYFDNGNYVNATDERGRQVNSFVAYWFAWYAFKPDTEVYTAPPPPPGRK